MFECKCRCRDFQITLIGQSIANVVIINKRKNTCENDKKLKA